MFPQFIGSGDDALYGVYHRPTDPLARAGIERSRSARVGVVLCPPLFHEAANAHRALRSLAEQLAKAGVHVLRFDYRGTGNSFGHDEPRRLEDWTADIRRAAGELAASRGLDRVGLVGLRFGANLAAGAIEQLDDLAFLVLWDPLPGGGDYLAELRTLQRAWVEHEASQRPLARQIATEHEVLGSPLDDQLAESLEHWRWPGAQRTSAPVLCLDESQPSSDALERALRSSFAAVDHRPLADGGKVWTRDGSTEQARVPRAVIDQVVGWVGEVAS